MKYIGLLDCNNFFVSCERLFRPDLAGKPVAVLSSNDGCVVARSNEVKALNVPMGVPVFQVKDIFKEHNVTLFSSNFTLYRDVSRRVMDVLRDTVGEIQIYSVDEAFFALDSDGAEGRALEVKATIERLVGVPVTIGVGKTKTIAKAASDIGKKQGKGAFVLDGEVWGKEAQSMHIGSVWGIGRQTSAKCTGLGIHTVADYLALDPAQVQKLLGIGGARIQAELAGTVVSKLGSERDTQKSVMSSRSFRSALSTLPELEDALAYHAESIGQSLRKQGVLAHTLSVTLRASRHGDFALRGGSLDMKLESPTDDTSTILRAAKKLLTDLFEPDVPFKKIGVVAGGFVPAGNETGSLFDKPVESEKDENKTSIGVVVDELNNRFSDSLITIGRIPSGKQAWGARRDLVSPKYTTDWKELKTVKSG